MRCVFANATFTGGHGTARSHEKRSRGGVLSCRVRWHMRGGMRVPPYHACAPQQRAGSANSEVVSGTEYDQWFVRQMHRYAVGIISVLTEFGEPSVQGNVILF